MAHPDDNNAPPDAATLMRMIDFRIPLPWRVSDSQRMYCFEWCWYAMTGANPNWRVTPEQLLWLAAKMNAGRAV